MPFKERQLEYESTQEVFNKKYLGRHFRRPLPLFFAPLRCAKKSSAHVGLQTPPSVSVAPKFQ